MTIAHAFIIGGNLLLAVLLYVVTASSRRGEAWRLGLVAAFALLALVDVSTGTTSAGAMWSILAADIVLLGLLVLFALHERRQRRRRSAAREARFEPSEVERAA